eukprot:1159883-Pelagomonas_calceolata.AAC.9
MPVCAFAHALLMVKVVWYLMLAYRGLCDVVVASVYVNPTQFSANEDFDVYPRDVEGDRTKLEEAGCCTVFEPRSLYRGNNGDASNVVGREGASPDAHETFVQVGKERTGKGLIAVPDYKGGLVCTRDICADGHETFVQVGTWVRLAWLQGEAGRALYALGRNLAYKTCRMWPGLATSVLRARSQILRSSLGCCCANPVLVRESRKVEAKEFKSARKQLAFLHSFAAY